MSADVAFFLIVFLAIGVALAVTIGRMFDDADRRALGEEPWWR